MVFGTQVAEGRDSKYTDSSIYPQKASRKTPGVGCHSPQIRIHSHPLPDRIPASISIPDCAAAIHFSENLTSAISEWPVRIFVKSSACKLQKVEMQVYWHRRAPLYALPFHSNPPHDQLPAQVSPYAQQLLRLENVIFQAPHLLPEQDHQMSREKGIDR